MRPSPADEVHIQRASTKRREEFAAGRLCAAAALKFLGAGSEAVGREPGGAPIWPSGVVGSISHTDDVAAVAVMPSGGFSAIGLDIERVGAVEPAFWRTLFSNTERGLLEQGQAGGHRLAATALFAAKEAFYKAQWPITHEWVDFLDIEVELDGDVFEILPLTPRAWVRSLPPRPRGRLAARDDVVAAAVIIPRP